MTIPIRQNTTPQEIPLGYFLDSSNGDDEETGLTIANTDIKLWKHGATTLANKNSGGATHISNGIYYCVLDATDSDTLGGMVVFVHVAGALAVRVECEVMTANKFDSLVLGTDVLRTNVVKWLSTTPASPTVAGVPEVDITHCGGSAVAAGAIPNAAADAAGGLPISDVGNLDLDAKLATTDEIGTAGAGLTDLGGMSTGMKTEVNDQVVDVLKTDTVSEMAQAAPPETPTFEDMLAYVYFRLRNKNVETETEHAVYDNAGTTKLFKATMSDDGTNFEKAEYVSGA